jgi:hypothetical protein
VATDANCRGYGERKRETDGAVGDLKDWVVCAVPDRLLIDSAAFKAAPGRGCSAPDMKCDRDRYKQRLVDALVAAVTARRPTERLASFPALPQRDSAGLPMEIVHPAL